MKALKDPFAAGAAVLTAVAFAGSFTHTRETVAQYGQTGWMATATALMPEGMVALGVLKIRRGGDRRELTWAWTVLVVAVAVTVVAAWFSAREVRRTDQMRFDQLARTVEVAVQARFDLAEGGHQ